MRRLLVILLILMALALVASLLLAASGELKVPWHAVAGGGGTSSDRDRFILAGAMGQAAAGQSTGGSRFQLGGGFVGGLPGQEMRWTVYLPLVEQR
jgi:hypothetical protein